MAGILSDDEKARIRDLLGELAIGEVTGTTFDRQDRDEYTQALLTFLDLAERIPFDLSEHQENLSELFGEMSRRYPRLFAVPAESVNDLIATIKFRMKIEDLLLESDALSLPIGKAREGHLGYLSRLFDPKDGTDSLVRQVDEKLARLTIEEARFARDQGALLPYLQSRILNVVSSFLNDDCSALSTRMRRNLGKEKYQELLAFCRSVQVQRQAERAGKGQPIGTAESILATYFIQSVASRYIQMLSSQDPTLYELCPDYLRQLTVETLVQPLAPVHETEDSMLEKYDEWIDDWLIVIQNRHGKDESKWSTAIQQELRKMRSDYAHLQDLPHEGTFRSVLDYLKDRLPVVKLHKRIQETCLELESLAQKTTSEITRNRLTYLISELKGINRQVEDVIIDFKPEKINPVLNRLEGKLTYFTPYFPKETPVRGCLERLMDCILEWFHRKSEYTTTKEASSSISALRDELTLPKPSMKHSMADLKRTRNESKEDQPEADHAPRPPAK